MANKKSPPSKNKKYFDQLAAYIGPNLENWGKLTNEQKKWYRENYKTYTSGTQSLPTVEVKSKPYKHPVEKILEQERDSLYKFAASDMYRNSLPIDTMAVLQDYKSDKELAIEKSETETLNKMRQLRINYLKQKGFPDAEKLVKKSSYWETSVPEDVRLNFYDDKSYKQFEKLKNTLRPFAERIGLENRDTIGVIDKYRNVKQQEVLNRVNSPFNYGVGDNYFRSDQPNTLAYYHIKKDFLAFRPTTWNKVTTVAEELAHRSQIDEAGSGNQSKLTSKNISNVNNLISNRHNFLPNTGNSHLEYLTQEHERKAKQYATIRYLADHGYELGKPIDDKAYSVLEQNKDKLPSNVADYYNVYLNDMSKKKYNLNKYKNGGKMKPSYEKGFTPDMAASIAQMVPGLIGAIPRTQAPGAGGDMQGLTSALGAAGSIASIIPGGEAIGAGLNIASSIANEINLPSDYVPMGENQGKFSRVKGGSLNPISSNSYEVQGNNPSVTDGVELPNAFVDHGETISGDYVFSTERMNPFTGNTFAKDAKKIAKAKGKAEKLPYDTAAKNTLKYLGEQEQKLAGMQDTINGLLGEAQQYKQSLKGGGKLDPLAGAENIKLLSEDEPKMNYWQALKTVLPNTPHPMFGTTYEQTARTGLGMAAAMVPIGKGVQAVLASRAARAAGIQKYMGYLDDAIQQGIQSMQARKFRAGQQAYRTAKEFDKAQEALKVAEHARKFRAGKAASEVVRSATKAPPKAPAIKKTNDYSEIFNEIFKEGLAGGGMIKPAYQNGPIDNPYDVSKLSPLIDFKTGRWIGEPLNTGVLPTYGVTDQMASGVGGVGQPPAGPDAVTRADAGVTYGVNRGPGTDPMFDTSQFLLPGPGIAGFRDGQAPTKAPTTPATSATSRGKGKGKKEDPFKPWISNEQMNTMLERSLDPLTATDMPNLNLPYDSVTSTTKEEPGLGPNIPGVRGFYPNAPKQQGNWWGDKSEGERLQMMEAFGKAGMLLQGYDKQPLYQNRAAITRQQFDPQNALMQQQYAANAARQGIQNSSTGASQMANLQNLSANQMRAAGQVQTQYDQMNQQARSQYEQRLAQRQQENIGYKYATDQIRQQDESAYWNQFRDVMTGIGNMGREKVAVEENEKAVKLLISSYPDLVPFLDSLGIDLSKFKTKSQPKEKPIGDRDAFQNFLSGKLGKTN